MVLVGERLVARAFCTSFRGNARLTQGDTTVVSDLIEAKGYGGSVSFDGQFVTIRRRGVGRLVVGKGEKRIPVRSISAIQLKPAGPIVNGFIEFSLSSGDERRSRFGRQTANAASDENSVIFTRGQQSAFEQLRAAIEQAIATGSTSQQHAYAPAPGLAEQLQQLSQLYASGALTEQEFAVAKAQLLDQQPR